MTPDCIWILSPPGYVHSHAFDEIALAMRGAFADLGRCVPIVRERERVEGVPLVLGANLLLTVPETDRPEQMILYNLEQVHEGSAWMRPEYLEVMRRHEVWDYSERNVAALAEHGVAHVRLCPIGYHRSLSRIPRAEEDIDILFVGSINDRRAAVLHQLVLQGLRVRALFGVFGKERDRELARARILLNVHYYETKVLELVRLSYWLANGRFIVSEPGGDEAIRAEFADGVVFADYGDITRTCLHYVHRRAERIDIAARGRELFARRKLSTSLTRLVSRSRRLDPFACQAHPFFQARGQDGAFSGNL